MLHVVCQRFTWDASYVNILYDMVCRNLPDGFEAEFVCFTDNPEGIDPRVKIRPLPYHLDEGFEEWGLFKECPWAAGSLNRLPMFKGGMFPDGDRVVFIDLDTVITGALDDIFAYDGKFAILRDYYRPDGLQYSFAMWEAGAVNEIYDSWVAAGQPFDVSDQQWIERCDLKPDILQKTFPGSFVSYKVDGCFAAIPKDTRVVIFHGQPKPHNCGSPWVEKVWKVGGQSLLDMKALPNVPDSVLLENITINSKRSLPWVTEVDAHDGHAVIVGSAPSLLDCFGEIRRRQGLGQVVFALNNAASVLVSHGIIPDYQVILDARAANIGLICQEAKAYLFASQVHPSVFDAVERDMTLWHPLIEDIEKVFPDHGEPYSLIGGGTTVGLSATCLAYTLGYRKLHLYGYDSSYRDGKGHAVHQDINNTDWTLDVMVGGKTFVTSPAMATQAQKFPILAEQLSDLGVIITVHGDGLLPEIARQMRPPIEQAA